MRVEVAQPVYPMLNTLVFAVTALIAGGVLASWVKRKGWPF